MGALEDLIGFSDLANPALWNELLSTRNSTILLVAEDIVGDAVPEKTNLVIATETNWEDLLLLLKSRRLPATCPILVLVTNAAPPRLPANLNNNWFLDFLALPIHRQLLVERIVFLAKINQTMAITQAQSATMDKHLTTLYSRDGLTGLFNRRHLTIHLQEIFKQSGEKSQDLSLLLINIDYFNSINRLHGLQFGDAILNQMAARLTQHTRPDDSCYRFSGEDFLVLMPDTDLDTASQLAKELNAVCTAQPFGNTSQKKYITISIGLASLRTHRPVDHEELICMAESALFTAKAEGRNRIRHYEIQYVPKTLSAQQSILSLNETLSRILEKTRRSAIASIQLLARNVAGPEHQDHIDKTLQLFDLLGAEMNLPEHHIQTFHNAAALYNSFRFLVHRDLLSKESNFSSSDREILSDLPFRLAEITDMFAYFNNEKEVLQNHCERYDGSGYPLGLKGKAIPFGARLFNLINSVAAMSADRPYRTRLTPKEIVEELRLEAGRQFDPDLVIQVLQLIKRHNFFNISADFIDKISNHISSSLQTTKNE